MKFIKFSILVGSSVLVVASPALAAEAAQPGDDAGSIVVVATGFARSADETGQAISVITRERLDQLQSVTVADALATLPSVSVSRRGPVGTQTGVFVRGANTSQTLVLVDGVRVNDPSSPNAAFDFGGLLAGNVERIELLRGPNSIVWGSQAIGGVVNIETALPSTALTLRTTAEYGTYDTLSGQVSVAGSSGALGYSLGGAFYRTDGFSVFSGGTEPDGSRQAALNGRIALTLAEGVELDLRGSWSDGRIDYDSAYSGGANSLAEAHNRQWFGYAGVNFTAAGGRLKSRIAVSRSDIDRVGTDPVVFSFNNYVATGVTDRIEYRGAYELSDGVTLFAGLEHEHIRSSTSYEGAAPDRASNRMTGGYVQVSLRPLDWLTLTGGVRHDHYSDYGGHTTLGGNIAYSPNGGATVLRATYAEGFRAPTLTEGQPPYGNPALKPETARNLDIGIEQQLLDGRASLSLTWYRRRSNDLITFSFASFMSENIGRVEADGIELGLVLRPVPRLRIEANYARANAVNRSAPNDGKRLPLRPRDTAHLTADWDSPLGLKLGATLTLVGDSFDDNANLVRIDGHARVDIRASLPLGERVELFGRVDNLTGESYETVSGYATPGRAVFAGARLRI